MLLTLATALVAAIGGQIVNIIVALKTGAKVDENTRVTKDTKESLAAVAEKAAVIEGHVNSAASTYQEKIRSLEEQNKLLERFASEQREIARTLATADAAKLPAPTTPTPGGKTDG